MKIWKQYRLIGVTTKGRTVRCRFTKGSIYELRITRSPVSRCVANRELQKCQAVRMTCSVGRKHASPRVKSSSQSRRCNTMQFIPQILDCSLLEQFTLSLAETLRPRQCCSTLLLRSISINPIALHSYKRPVSLHVDDHCLAPAPLLPCRIFRRR